jgi:DNA repair protein RadC
MELSKRVISGSRGSVRVRLRDSRQVAEILMEEMMYEKREFFMTLNLNSKLQVESKSVISIGSLDSAPVHPREVFGPAVRRGAAAVVVAHNHPSGIALPSQEDITITANIIKALLPLGIRVADHIIISGNDYVSLAQSDRFKEIFE